MVRCSWFSPGVRRTPGHSLVPIGKPSSVRIPGGRMFRHVSALAADPVSVSGSNLTWVVMSRSWPCSRSAWPDCWCGRCSRPARAPEDAGDCPGRAGRRGCPTAPPVQDLSVFVVIIFFVLAVAARRYRGVRWGRSVFFLVGPVLRAHRVHRDVAGGARQRPGRRGGPRRPAASASGQRIAFRTGGVAGMFHGRPRPVRCPPWWC